MAKISNQAIEAAYWIAKQVIAKEITREAGITKLEHDYALNRSSAGDTISNIQYMLQGNLR